MLDFYHDKINLFYKGNKGPKSLVGCIITLIVSIIFIFLVLGFGSDFFYRQNPSFLSQDIYPEEYKKYNLTMENFPLVFRFEDPNGQFLDSEGKSFYLDIYYQKLIKINGSWEYNLTLLNYSRCEKSDYPNKKEFELKGFANAFCINNFNDIEYGGNWDGTFLNYIYFNYMKCEEGSIRNGQNCNNSTITNELIQSLAYISLFIPTIMYDPTNYTSPFIKNMINIYYQIDANIVKLININLIEYISTSDIGWLIENKISNSILSYYSSSTDYSLSSSFKNDQSYSNYLGSISFLMIKKQVNYVRLYSKIQSLAANIGGILKFITFFLNLFIQIYSNIILDYDLSLQINDKLKKYSISKKVENISNENDGMILERINKVEKHNLNNLPQKKLLATSLAKISLVSVLSNLKVDKIQEESFEISGITFQSYLYIRIKSSFLFCFKHQHRNFKILQKKIVEYLDIRNVLDIIMSNIHYSNENKSIMR